jgi:hypothetical protein
MHLAWLGPVPQSTIVGGVGSFPVWICFLTIVPSSTPSLANKQTKNLKEKKNKKPQVKKKNKNNTDTHTHSDCGFRSFQVLCSNRWSYLHHHGGATTHPRQPQHPLFHSFFLSLFLMDGLCASRNSSDSGTQALLKRVSVVGCCPPHWVRRTDGRTTAPPSSINDQSGSFKTPICPPPPSPPPPQVIRPHPIWTGTQLEAD